MSYTNDVKIQFNDSELEFIWMGDISESNYYMIYENEKFIKWTVYIMNSDEDVWMELYNDELCIKTYETNKNNLQYDFEVVFDIFKTIKKVK